MNYEGQEETDLDTCTGTSLDKSLGEVLAHFSGLVSRPIAPSLVNPTATATNRNAPKGF